MHCPTIARRLLALLPLCAGPGLAGEVGDLDINMPNTLEDAFAGERGSLELAGAGRYQHDRSGGDTLRLYPRLQWVPAERLQVSASLPYTTGSGSGANQGEGSLGIHYQLNREGPGLPAFALSADANGPVGPGDRATEIRLGGIASRTLAEGPAQPRLHVNAYWYQRFAPAEDERHNRYRVTLGASRLVARDTAFIGNVLRESQERGQRDATILEAGLRHQLSRAMVIGGALGAGIGRDSPGLRVILSVQLSLN